MIEKSREQGCSGMPYQSGYPEYQEAENIHAVPEILEDPFSNKRFVLIGGIKMVDTICPLYAEIFKDGI